MFDDDLFDHLTPRGTFDIVLHDVHIPRDSDKPVVLTAKFAGKGSPYWNAMMKLKPLADATAATERAATLLAKLAIVGWQNVSKNGVPVVYSAELGAEVLHKLIRAKRAEKVDYAIAAAMNPDNYREPIVEAVDLGKE
ncbi:MAG: hypothetical protein EHM89_00220 [Acidobacteria bacterium]|nr:MAG: hypothetical protein EHM89_00220 [Acidobacteriota bacterium]